MPKFTIRAYATDFYEKEIEAETEEEAKRVFQEQWEKGEITSDQTDFSFEDEDEQLEDEDDFEDEEEEEEFIEDSDSELKEL